MDLRLGLRSQGSMQTTLDQARERTLDSAEGQRAKGYDEVKAYIGTLGANATLRVKHGSGEGELALGKQNLAARLFKGDRSELTAHTLANVVKKRFGAVAQSDFLARLTQANGRFDVSRDAVLAALAGVEEKMGLSNLRGEFERRPVPDLTGETAVKVFSEDYPSRMKSGQGIAEDGLDLSGRFHGDIVLRGHARVENGVLHVGRGLEGSTPEQNLAELKKFFSEQLGIDSNDTTQMSNAMNNVLNFFDQNCYISAAGRAADSLKFNSGDHDIKFEGTLKLDGANLSITRSISTNLKEAVVESGGLFDRESGWRYQAEDSFKLPLANALVPNTEFKPESMTEARRTQNLEKGQRQVDGAAEFLAQLRA